MQKQVMDGVFAINKPADTSSAQLLRDLQQRFNTSHLFAPWVEEQYSIRARESRRQWDRRKDRKKPIQVKLGHGGTLDQPATGVLIIGVNNGTKKLPNFLTSCSKTYEAVIVFGTATDTYDGEGKVVVRRPWEHITQEKVREAFPQFRGKIKQKVPAFSALRHQGKRFYEFAREGKDIPVEIPVRDMEVESLELVEWMKGGKHHWSVPQTEADEAERKVALKAMGILDPVSAEDLLSPDCVDSSDRKRKRQKMQDEDAESAASPSAQPPRLDPDSDRSSSHEGTPDTAKADTPEAAEPATSPAPQSESDHQPPAVKIRVTATSGFYVRSLCHDLGRALGSVAFMANLVRTRQGRFQLGKNVIEFANLAEGEEVWRPQIEGMLKESQAEDQIDASASPSVEKSSQTPIK